MPVSVVVTTFNEERNIRACLGSVAGWCRDLFVIDSGSGDRTQEIAREYTDEVVVHEYVDHPSQWEWALANLPLRTDWVLAIDADNVVSEQLKREIASVLRDERPGVNGYYSTHVHYFQGSRVRGLKKQWLRLIRRDSARVDRSELVDLRFIVEGEIGVLRGEIVESNANERSIDFWIDKHQRFATRMAIEEVLRRAGKRTSEAPGRWLGNADERMVWMKARWYRFPLYVRPVGYFLYRYLLKGGFLDGKNGFVYHALQAFWFRLLVDVKISELERQVSVGERSLDELEALARGNDSRATT